MKKLITIILILALVPVIALADERDPIVGSWYMYVDISITPELAGAFNNSDMLLLILKMNDGGTISSITFALNGSEDNYDYSPAGKWEKDGDSYSLSIVGIGKTKAVIQDGDLIFDAKGLTGYNIGMKLHKLKEFDPYSDYIFNFN
jgi:hypothetical protein